MQDPVARLWETEGEVIDPRTPLFVTGCSRSGTTALVHLLNVHPDVVIGMERFKHVYSRREQGSLAGMFTRPRFLDFRDGDTNITPSASPRWRRFYEIADKKLADEGSGTIGDKALATPGILSFLTGEYPNAHWIFIFREVVGVAGSYVKRADNSGDVNWPQTKRHREALGDWRRAFEAVDTLIAEVGSERVFPVSYERLFSGDNVNLKALFGFLDRNVPHIVTAKFSSMTSDWEKRTSAPSPLTQDERDWLTANRPQDLEERYEELSRMAIERWG